jgi:hypothetical protein
MVLALVALVLAGCGSSGPKAAVENFMEAAKDKDCEKMVDLMDLSAFEAAGLSQGKEEIIQSCKDESGIGDLVSYKITDEKTEGDIATVTVEVTTKEDGTENTETDTLTVNKINGEWKVSFI